MDLRSVAILCICFWLGPSPGAWSAQTSRDLNVCGSELELLSLLVNLEPELREHLFISMEAGRALSPNIHMQASMRGRSSSQILIELDQALAQVDGPLTFDLQRKIYRMRRSLVSKAHEEPRKSELVAELDRMQVIRGFVYFSLQEEEVGNLLSFVKDVIGRSKPHWREIYDGLRGTYPDLEDEMLAALESNPEYSLMSEFEQAAVQIRADRLMRRFRGEGKNLTVSPVVPLIAQ